MIRKEIEIRHLSWVHILIFEINNGFDKIKNVFDEIKNRINEGFVKNDHRFDKIENGFHEIENGFHEIEVCLGGDDGGNEKSKCKDEGSNRGKGVYVLGERRVNSKGMCKIEAKANKLVHGCGQKL